MNNSYLLLLLSTLKKLFFILLLFSFSCCFNSARAHEYFVSITEAEYDENNGRIELSISLTGHDLEKALSDIYEEKVRLDDEQHHNKISNYLTAYIQSYLEISCDSKPLELEYVGHLLELDDKLYIFVQAKSSKPKTIKISNYILCDYFPLQENYVYWTQDGNKKSLVFNSEKKHGTIEW